MSPFWYWMAKESCWSASSFAAPERLTVASGVGVTVMATSVIAEVLVLESGVPSCVESVFVACALKVISPLKFAGVFI